MSLDKALLKKTRDRWKQCSKGHLNSPNARVCWKCGEELKEVKVKMSENERACPHCGSKTRKVVLGDNSTFEVMRVITPPNKVVVRVVVCVECGTVYDSIKEVKPID